MSGSSASAGSTVREAPRHLEQLGGGVQRAGPRLSSLGHVRISSADRDTLIEHAREEAPNECCGYLRARDGAVEEVFRAVNQRNSPYGYELDPKSLFAVNDLDDEGFEVGVYHSHPRSPAEPSQTDINPANSPGWIYGTVSVGDERPGVRAWRIADGKVQEEPIEVD